MVVFFAESFTWHKTYNKLYIDEDWKYNVHLLTLKL